MGKPEILRTEDASNTNIDATQDDPSPSQEEGLECSASSDFLSILLVCTETWRSIYINKLGTIEENQAV